MGTDSSDGFLRVSAKSPVGPLAAAISHALYDGKPVILRAIGAGAVNQAMKGSAVARGYVAQRGLNLSLRPGFETVKMADADVSAMVFHVSAD